MDQFTRSDASQVATVSDRTADYDAIRPDVWSHLRSAAASAPTSHDSYRILDSEILQPARGDRRARARGLLSPDRSTRRWSLAGRSEREPPSAPIALVGAAAAVAFLVVSTLFDVMSFPHCPYIFLFIAGFLAAAVKPPEEP